MLAALVAALSLLHPAGAPPGKPLLTWTARPTTGASLYQTPVQVKLGSTYTFVVSGSWTTTLNGISETDDPFYEVARSNGCSCPVQLAGAIEVYVKGKPERYVLGSDSPPAYNPKHTYTLKWVPRASGILEIQNPLIGSGVTGSLTYRIYGQPLKPVKPGKHTTLVTITSLKNAGHVEIQKADGAWQPADNSQELKAGDKIHTGFKASVTITYPDGSTETIGSMTLVQIQKIGPRQGYSFVKYGEVTAAFTRNATRGDFQVRTPTTTASDRGTRFSVFSGGAWTIVSVTQDSVTVTPLHGKPAVVTAGHEVMATARSVAAPTGIGKADAPPGSVGPARALSLLTAAVSSGLAACKSDVSTYALSPLPHGWRATFGLTGAHAGSAVWTIAGTKVAPANALATTIAAGCR